MKKFATILVALLFNLIAAVSISAATAIPALAIFGGGTALSLLGGRQGLQMAVQKEIWMNTIVEGLFAQNSFLSKAFNADEFVQQGKTVHIPNAGNPSNVVKNRTTFPATVTARTDVDLTFDMDEYTTDPIKITNADKAELSYPKRNSVLKQDKAALAKAVAEDFIYKWSPADTYTIETTGAAVAAHTPSGVGNRKAFTKADVKSAMVAFNKQDVPQENRYMLVDADMYAQLLDSMTDKDSLAFFSQADVANGILGKLYSFNIMMRSRAALYDVNDAPKLWSAAAAGDDNAAALAWHENSVCRALGQAEMFDDTSNPLYYADIYSFLVRAGGRPMRSDVAGLLAIVQAPSA